MLPHCGNCGHMFRLDEVSLVYGGFHSKYDAAFKNVGTVYPGICPECKQWLKCLVIYSPEYFEKNGEFYSTND